MNVNTSEGMILPDSVKREGAAAEQMVSMLVALECLNGNAFSVRRIFAQGFRVEEFK